MHQFEIKRLIPFELFGFDASFTNSALFMVIAIIRFRHKAGRRAAYQPESKKLEAWLS